MAAIILVIVAYLYLTNGNGQNEANTDAPGGGTTFQVAEPQQGQTQSAYSPCFDLAEVPEYYGVKSYTVNGGNPYFTDEEISSAKERGSFEDYGKLDSLGRCTAAMDNLSRETMPAKGEQRESIRDIHPTGWKQVFYDCVDQQSVMTRTHLVGWMLSAENANERNLISGTRYMNSDAMTTFELVTARYIEKGTGRHVLYRVTPVFEGGNLLASGVLMEGLSLDDGGNGVRFCEYLYNVQPGIWFNYTNGKSQYSGIFFDTNSDTVVTDGLKLEKFVMDGNTIHTEGCPEITDGHAFLGDVAVKDSWTKFGYRFCDCAA